MRVEDHFQIVQADKGLFRFRFTGFVSSEAVDTLGPEIERLYQQAVDSFGGREFIVFADLRGLGPLPEKGKELVKRLMAYGATRGLWYSVNLNPSALATRSVRDAGARSETNEVRSTVGTVEEAEGLVARKLAELAGVRKL